MSSVDYEIRCENITIEAGDTTIIRDLSFAAAPRQKVLLFGPSGSGKSSIVKALLGFMPLSGGSIYFRGKKIGERDFWCLRRHVGYVPQNPDIGEGSLRSLIEYFFSLKANGPQPPEAEILTTFETFGLSPEYLEKKYSDFSGGEKQRAALALVLLLKRKVLFLDEITSALDEEMKRRVVDYVLSLEDSTQIIISHDSEWKRNGTMSVVPLTMAPSAEGGR